MRHRFRAAALVLAGVVLVVLALLVLALVMLALVAGLGAHATRARSRHPNPDLAGTLDERLERAFAGAGVRAPVRPAPDPPALVALGRALFFDPVLSGNRDVACASCHQPDHATSDGRPLPRLEAGRPGAARVGPRRVPALWNSGLPEVTSLFWDARVARRSSGRLETPEPELAGTAPRLAAIAGLLDGPLAAQALFPVASIPEMRGDPGTNELANAEDDEAVWAALAARLRAIPGYRSLSSLTFAGSSARACELHFGHAARALAAFERSAYTALDTPLDRWLGGQRAALSREAKEGALLFCGKAGCARCHGGPLLSDFSVHALAVPQLGPGLPRPGEDRGRAIVTKLEADTYRFRTPPLRNVAASRAFLHDGCFSTLEAAVRHHLDPARSLAAPDLAGLPASLAATLDRDATRNAARLAALDPALRQPTALSSAEVGSLLRFLEALTDAGALERARSDVPDHVPSGLAVRSFRE